MSIDIVNIFTSSENIEYLKNEISLQISDPIIRETIIENITETIFEFQEYNIIENSGKHLRQSTNVKNEVNKLNKAFIKDRIAFAKNFDMYASAYEDYANQMFIDDSLRPGEYTHFNDPICVDNKRLFRYQDKNNINRSNIPVWQILKRGDPDRINDALRNSEVSQVRKASQAVTYDHINYLPTDLSRPNWIDN